MSFLKYLKHMHKKFNLAPLCGGGGWTTIMCNALRVADEGLKFLGWIKYPIWISDLWLWLAVLPGVFMNITIIRFDIQPRATIYKGNWLYCIYSSHWKFRLSCYETRLKLSRGEICVANCIPPCKWCESG